MNQSEKNRAYILFAKTIILIEPEELPAVSLEKLELHETLREGTGKDLYELRNAVEKFLNAKTEGDFFGNKAIIYDQVKKHYKEGIMNLSLFDP